MSLLLTIETAIDTCSVGLFENENLLDFRENNDGKSHAAQLTVFIQDILQSNTIKADQLSAVAVSMGPGSYTGLRIGVSAAKGLCYGSNIPLIAVDTLQLMTNVFLKTTQDPIKENYLLCPMIDARRLEVYTSLFNTQGQSISETRAVIVDEKTFAQELQDHTILFFGNGAGKCKDLISHKNAFFIEGIRPLAQYMGNISYPLFINSTFEDLAYFEPFYLKDFVTTTPKNKII